MDNEHFELCKEVYKRFPSWKYGVDWMQVVNKGLDSEYINRVCYDPSDDEDDFLYEMGDYDNIPLYTSDYLLEKLPHYLEYWDGGNESGYLRVEKGTRDYQAGYFHVDQEFPKEFGSGWCDTPRKALLKLVIALHEAGELK